MEKLTIQNEVKDMNCAEIKNLTVKFGGKTLLENITTDLPKTGITVFLGRSGAGKTTLLRCINRLNECFDGCQISGRIKIDIDDNLIDIYGKEAPSVAQIRRIAGMLFQTPNPLPMSLRKNITLPLELSTGTKGEKAREIVERVLKQVGLWEEVKDRLNENASKFSGGQQQRLCLARTLVLSPKILLLDEPTASLDKKSAELIENLLLEIQNNMPVIMVSHNLTQAIKLGTHFKILSDGKLTKEFEASDIPANISSEKFLENLL